jgi:hypothetical protein
MTVRYIRVNAISNLFAPVTRAFGNIAVVGQVTPPASPPADLAVANTPLTFTDPAEALRRCPGDLGNAINLCFQQTPGPSLVYGVRTAAGPDWVDALEAVSALDAQIVMLANTPTDSSSATGPNGAIFQLSQHVTSVSNTGADGQERIGVAMLGNGVTDTTVVTNVGSLVNERMVYVAHKSSQDAAAAVAGTIASYEPPVSILLKPVNITSAQFTPTEIQAINGAVETAGPTGQGINWLTHPTLIPGTGIYMGGGKKFIDIVRVIDDVSFKLKAQLIRTIGNLRISRSGLRGVIAQMEVVLLPMVQAGVLDDYTITIPLLVMLDKDPTKLTAAELALINQAHAERLVQIAVAVSYAAAIHRLVITLQFS